MMPVSVTDELVYSAICSNRNEKNISCQGKYLLYSRCRCPVVYDLQSKQLVAFLVGHNNEVNGQCFVDVDNCNENTCFVISTAHDNSAIIWQVNGNPSVDLKDSHSLLYRFKSPDDSVFQTRCSIRSNDHTYLSIFTTIEGNIYFYTNDQLTQKIETKNCYFDAKIFETRFYDEVSDNSAKEFRFVSLAGSDNRVHIYRINENKELIHVLNLAGFNDWIKSLDLIHLPGRKNEFLLAAACQDSLIQVWHLRLTDLTTDAATEARTNVSVPLCNLPHGQLRLTSTLETVLSGHEGFVQNVCWFKNLQKSTSEQLQLLSCSADRTIIVWQSRVADLKPAEAADGMYRHCPASEGVWKQAVQLGETGEANLPFLGICLSNDERTIYGQSLRGAIHSWSLDTMDDGDTQLWRPKVSITGHFDAITDIVWDRTGKYLLSSSLDKTCRLHAIASEDEKWHEIARPQVHGYEINCLAPLNFIKFASGAEEKTIRTFEATQFFMRNFHTIAKAQLPSDHIDSPFINELPAHAQLPALGLSNRGSQCPFDVNEVSAEDTQQSVRKNASGGDKTTPNTTTATTTTSGIKLADNNSWHEVSDLVKQLSITDHLKCVPFEEILIQSTLWWEKNKLFGHCNELHALASTSSGTFLASASKANRADLASVIVWETEKFRKVATLEHHTLTITRLRFSPDDRHLLSVSRDRTWCLFERNPSGQLRNAYRKLVGTVKSNAVHERIIWDCCWTCDSRYFCTVSRDKKAIMWSVEQLRSQQLASDQEQELSLDKCIVSTRTFDRSIQAIESSSALMINANPREKDNSSSSSSGCYLFALGFEDGSLELHLIRMLDNDARSFEWQLVKHFANFHQLSIKRLAFRPQHDDDDDDDNGGRPSTSGVEVRQTSLLLASGGDDCVLRLTRLHFALIDSK